jgi:hypothetical protein
MMRGRFYFSFPPFVIGPQRQKEIHFDPSSTLVSSSFLSLSLSLSSILYVTRSRLSIPVP